MPSTACPRLAAICVLAIVASARPATAQPPAPPPEPPPRLEASAQFTFLDTGGNTSTQSLGTGGEIVWRPDPWTYVGKVIFAQSESDDELNARSLAALFRASRGFGPRLSAYSQYDFLRNLFAGVEQRHVIEGGVSYLALDKQPHRVRFDAGLGYLYEDAPDDHFDSATLSLGAAYRMALSATSELTYDPRFLLSLAEADAWRFEQIAALTVAMNTRLSLKLAHTVRYSAQPPAGFETTDTILAISLVAKVRRAQ